MARVVLDTNVLVSAIRSRRGASFALLEHLARGDFEAAVSVPLVLEYEDALLRHIGDGPLDSQDVSDLLDAICATAHRQAIFFLWRPLLPDPNDDMVAELVNRPEFPGGSQCWKRSWKSAAFRSRRTRSHEGVTAA